MKLCVLGNGGFGTAMAMVAHRAGHGVRLWGHDADYTAEVARTRQNPRYLEGISVPGEITVTADAGAALHGADVILAAVPTQHLRSVFTALTPVLPERMPVVSLAKGLEQTTGLRPSQVVAEIAPDHPVLVLGGPSHAEEVARGLPATVVLAGDEDSGVRTLQEALSSTSFRIYRNRDLLGTELCGALKNVIALAAGIADGLGFGDNAKAAILTRGLVEMARFGVAEGAELQTFYGLAGVGDLAVTAFSKHGRNRGFGERIGGGQNLEQALGATRKVAEGVWTSRVVRQRAHQLGVEMPLCDAVCRVLFEGVPARDAVRELMERDPKHEQLG